jgi:hypothetical protein
VAKSRHFPVVCLEEPRKITTNLSEYSVFRSRFDLRTSKIQAYSVSLTLAYTICITYFVLDIVVNQSELLRDRYKAKHSIP